MELLDYLKNWFYTKQHLLNLCKISESQLALFQSQQVMPLPSYTLKLDIESNSFCGLYSSTETVEFYAKGYASWLGLLSSLSLAESAFDIFAKRYKAQVAYLVQQGFQNSFSTQNSEIDIHVKQEWEHFLNGTYGLCTRSGLPEDIASKDLATKQINTLTNSVTKFDLSSLELESLQKAVTLLDESSSLFAPHERLQSSRHRLVNEVRRIYSTTR